MGGGAWWAAVHGVAKSQTQRSNFTFAFHFHALEKEMATHFSVLAWRIPGTGEPGGLLSLGSHRDGHDWSDLAEAAGIPTVLFLLPLVAEFFKLLCLLWFLPLGWLAAGNLLFSRRWRYGSSLWLLSCPPILVYFSDRVHLHYSRNCTPKVHKDLATE